MEVIYERCAGLDVGKDEVVACIRVPDGAGGRRQELCRTDLDGSRRIVWMIKRMIKPM